VLVLVALGDLDKAGAGIRAQHSASGDAGVAEARKAGRLKMATSKPPFRLILVDYHDGL